MKTAFCHVVVAVAVGLAAYWWLLYRPLEFYKWLLFALGATAGGRTQAGPSQRRQPPPVPTRRV